MAAKRTDEFSTFAAISGGNPSYFSGLAAGLTAGLDFSVHLNRFLAPGIEIRVNRDSNNQLIERSVLFGPLIQTTFHSRYHPYAALFIGGGTIVFLNNSAGYHEDRSKVYSYGGGLDIDLTRHFAAKFDLQSQSWNIGSQSPGGSDLTFSPNLLIVGVRYSIPFRPHESRRY